MEAEMEGLRWPTADPPGYTLKWLGPEAAERLQRLYERCSDYAILVDGEPSPATAAEEEFRSVPPGRSLDDKVMFGLIAPTDDIVGLLEGLRHYPDEATWWLGLLLLLPDRRGQRLGEALTSGFLELARGQGAKAVMLGVLLENEAGRRFWERQGFVEVRRTEPRPFGKKVHTVIVMRHEV
jgi:GNAT superfamily N-acetyltransferase